MIMSAIEIVERSRARHLSGVEIDQTEERRLTALLTHTHAHTRLALVLFTQPLSSIPTNSHLRCHGVVLDDELPSSKSDKRCQSQLADKHSHLMTSSPSGRPPTTTFTPRLGELSRRRPVRDVVG